MTTLVDDRPTAGTAGSATRRPLVVAALGAAIAGLALRLAVLGSSLGDLDSDEAIAGLMARRMLDGDFDTFYTGQAYGGSQESVLSAAVFAVVGSSVWALKAVMVALTVATVVLTWRVGRRVLSERAAVLGAALVWVGPPFAVWWSTKARGFYGMSTVTALVAILAVLRLVDRPTRRDAVLLGVAVGLGWWASPQSAVLAGAVVLWAAVVQPRLLRLAPLGVLGALVGAGPWLVFNLRNAWVSLDRPDVAREATVLERFGSLFTEALPRYLGLQEQLDGDWRLGPVAVVAYLVLAAAVVAWAADALRSRDRRLALLAPLALFPLYFASNPFTAFPEPRYVWVVGPVLALVVADVVVRAARSLGHPLVAYALVPLVVVGSAAGLVALEDRAGDQLGRWDVVSGDVDPLVDELVARGHTHAFADYWIAYKLSFESDERLVATGAQHTRGMEDRMAVEADPRPAYVTFVGDPVAEQIRANLEAAGVDAERVVVGYWEAYLPQEDVPSELRTWIYPT